MIKINIIKIPLKERKLGILRNAKDPAGEVMYVRNDTMGLLSVLGKFDSRLHTIKDMRIWNRIRDDIRQVYYDDSSELELSVDGASFLLNFLKEVHIKDSKEQSFNEFEIQTIVGIVDQLEDSDSVDKSGLDKKEKGK